AEIGVSTPNFKRFLAFPRLCFTLLTVEYGLFNCSPMLGWMNTAPVNRISISGLLLYAVLRYSTYPGFIACPILAYKITSPVDTVTPTFFATDGPHLLGKVIKVTFKSGSDFSSSSI